MTRLRRGLRVEPFETLHRRKDGAVLDVAVTPSPIKDDQGRVGALSDDHRQIVGHILTSSRHLVGIVNDVLDLARAASGQTSFRPELVDVARLVREVRDVLQPLTAEKRLHILTHIVRNLGLVELDPGRLKQVLYNYLSNAIKFTPPGARISISVTIENEAMFRIAVRDSGLGIAQDQIGRLFIEFAQVDSQKTRRAQGTGLGLALTKRIVEAQGGAVGVRSTLGKGSTFFAVLPRRHQSSDAEGSNKIMMAAAPDQFDRAGALVHTDNVT